MTVLTIDSRGRRCPLPVIDLAKAVLGVADGDVVAVLADDPAAATDIPAWARMRGHAYLGSEPVDGATKYLVRRIG
jgi:TusA-related sulfurtransferase